MYKVCHKSNAKLTVAINTRGGQLVEPSQSYLMQAVREDFAHERVVVLL